MEFHVELTFLLYLNWKAGCKDLWFFDSTFKWKKKKKQDRTNKYRYQKKSDKDDDHELN